MKHFREITVDMNDPDNWEDSPNVYGFDRQDDERDRFCTGECVTRGRAHVGDCGSVRCAHCGEIKA